MDAVPLQVGLVLLFLLPVKLKLSPYAGYVRLNASA